MSKRGKGIVKTQEDMDALMVQESLLYYISFLGDAMVIKEEITFTKSVAERHYVMLFNHAIGLFNKARNLKEKDEASKAFLSLQLLPLRIH